MKKETPKMLGGSSRWFVVMGVTVLLMGGMVRAEEEDEVVVGEGTVDQDLGSSREGSRTDSEVSS